MGEGKVGSMSELKITTPESSGTLEFFSGQCQTLAVVACAAWEKGTKPVIRDAFRDAIRQSIYEVTSGDERGLEERADGLIIKATTPRGKLITRPEGFAGFSMAMVSNTKEGTANTYYTDIVTYVGHTGVLVAPYQARIERPQATYFSDGNGLFSIRPSATVPASADEMLTTTEPPTVYIGEYEQLMAMRETNTLTSFSHTHASIIGKVTAVGAVTRAQPELHMLVDPVEHHYAR